MLSVNVLEYIPHELLYFYLGAVLLMICSLILTIISDYSWIYSFNILKHQFFISFRTICVGVIIEYLLYNYYTNLIPTYTLFAPYYIKNLYLSSNCLISYLYFIISFIYHILLSEFILYCFHRWIMHEWKYGYNKIHKYHHKYILPTPLVALYVSIPGLLFIEFAHSITPFLLLPIHSRIIYLWKIFFFFLLIVPYCLCTYSNIHICCI